MTKLKKVTKKYFFIHKEKIPVEKFKQEHHLSANKKPVSITLFSNLLDKTKKSDLFQDRISY
jgi:hypothetical protein